MPTDPTARVNATTPPPPADSARGVALVTGATGYIGRRLVPALLKDGWTVRVLVRRAARLEPASWQHDVEVVEADAGSSADLDRALAGVHVAYYLIHSMGSDADFAERDRSIARDFARSARQAHVRRIVYLGGLHPSGEPLSNHLASREEVGRILLGSGVPTAVLQAAVVLGTGSASFDMLRHLSARLPVMITPRWLRNRVQPIAVGDVIHYLTGAADLPDGVSRSFDIGGPDILTYAQMLRRHATLTGHRRPLIATVPVLTPRLASLWIGLVTPLDMRLARPLVDSLIHEVVCAEEDIRELVPDPPEGLTPFDDAVRASMCGTPPDPGPRNLAMTSAVTAAAAMAGSLATTAGADWYKALDLPPWQPPQVAFPVVWTALYADIAATSAAVLTDLEAHGRGPEAAAYRRALYANLALNTGWSVIFWRLRRPWAAAAESALLTISCADLARRAGRSRTGRRNRLLPYPAWTAFATALTAAIARRNPRS
ncbi:MAG: tryptophan-rich sensory protein [Intrasporangium sp.]|uniref:tryptophan-rich sensory protein n=1 Tax=Intrasporangium sp. TaxID=1925024 RepID=UPI002648157F|nr:tryptophan-rich sensory protein [Intrasporangium sp.]MDN5796178.1 tryptophan-rich sensory protein [Intrasporangium sp.]